MNASGYVRFVEGSSIVQINLVDDDDGGSFSCEAENLAGKKIFRKDVYVNSSGKSF